MKIALIVALSRNRVIGRAGGIPWRLPEDLKRFKRLTLGHTVIMGRKTYESIGRPLPERRNLVISRRADYRATGATVVASFEQALELCRNEAQVYVIGGAEIYGLALPRAHRLELTWIEREIEGDTRFPEWSASEFRETASEAHLDAEPPYRFVTMERVAG